MNINMIKPEQGVEEEEEECSLEDEVDVQEYKNHLMSTIPYMDLVRNQYFEWEQLSADGRQEIKTGFMNDVLRNQIPALVSTRHLRKVYTLIRAYETWSDLQANAGACGVDLIHGRMSQMQENDLYRVVSSLQEAIIRYQDRSVPFPLPRIPFTPPTYLPRIRIANPFGTISARSLLERSHREALLAHVNRACEAAGRRPLAVTLTDLTAPSTPEEGGSGDAKPGPSRLVNSIYQARSNAIEYLTKRITKRVRSRSRSKSSTSSGTTVSGRSVVLGEAGDGDDSISVNISSDDDKQPDSFEDPPLPEPHPDVYNMSE